VFSGLPSLTGPSAKPAGGTESPPVFTPTRSGGRAAGESGRARHFGPTGRARGAEGVARHACVEAPGVGDQRAQLEQLRQPSARPHADRPRRRTAPDGLSGRPRLITGSDRSDRNSRWNSSGRPSVLRDKGSPTTSAPADRQPRPLARAWQRPRKPTIALPTGES
jgi:hypothetical protein